MLQISNIANFESKTNEYNQIILNLLGKDYYSMDLLLTVMAFEVFG